MIDTLSQYVGLKIHRLFSDLMYTFELQYVDHKN
jgi:hypothetical protein